MKSIITDKWILCPECKAKTRTQVLENTELKNFPLFCPKCKKNFIINVKDHIVIGSSQDIGKIFACVFFCTISRKTADKRFVYMKIRDKIK